MVWGGSPSSQRKRSGAANQTRPVAVRGWASDFRDRVWMTWADQVRMLVCAASQEVRAESGAGADRAPCDPAASAHTPRTRGRERDLRAAAANRPVGGAIFRLTARWARSDTIGRDVVEWRARMHAGFPA